MGRGTEGSWNLGVGRLRTDGERLASWIGAVIEGDTNPTFLGKFLFLKQLTGA